MSSQRLERPAAPLAPRWHTAALIGLILAVAVTGALLTSAGGHSIVSVSPARGGRILGVYLPLAIVSLGLTLYVCRVGRRSNALRSLLGRGGTSAARAAADLAAAGATWFLIEAAESVAGTWRNAAAGALLPGTSAERIVWVLVAVTVGFCEEVIYRGYLQTQLTAFTGRASVAILLQAALFGIAHGDQGVAVVVRFTLYGVLFGALARWRRSLIPGIAAHIGLDLASGLLAG